jgi:quinol monooxygenase YgiN
MLITSVQIKVPPNRRDEILKTLSSMIGPTRVLTGCVSCRFYQDVENPNVLTLIEEWEYREALDRHVRSNDYRKILAAMDLASEPPKVQFCSVSSISGMELIKEIREGEGEGE